MRARALIVALPLLVAALTLAAPPVADFGVHTADAKHKKKHKKKKGDKHNNNGGAGSCTDADTQPQDLTVEAAQRAIQCLLDVERNQHGMSGLAANNALSDAAQRHSTHMVENSCFAHECPGELGLILRIKTAGYLDGVLSWAVGENIAWGQTVVGTPASIVKSWMNSPPHRANILNSDFEDVGVGVALGSPDAAGDSSAATYTANFGFNHG